MKATPSRQSSDGGRKEKMHEREGRYGVLQHILISQSPEFSNSLWKFKGQ